MLFLRQLALCTGRNEFTFIWGRSFASENSPPRIAATQYSLATCLLRVRDGLRLSLVGFMVSSTYGVRRGPAAFASDWNFDEFAALPALIARGGQRQTHALDWLRAVL